MGTRITCAITSHRHTRTRSSRHEEGRDEKFLLPKFAAREHRSFCARIPHRSPPEAISQVPREMHSRNCLLKLIRVSHLAETAKLLVRELSPRDFETDSVRYPPSLSRIYAYIIATSRVKLDPISYVLRTNCTWFPAKVAERA